MLIPWHGHDPHHSDHASLLTDQSNNYQFQTAVEQSLSERELPEYWLSQLVEILHCATAKAAVVQLWWRLPPLPAALVKQIPRITFILTKTFFPVDIGIFPIYFPSVSYMVHLPHPTKWTIPYCRLVYILQLHVQICPSSSQYTQRSNKCYEYLWESGPVQW